MRPFATSAGLVLSAVNGEVVAMVTALPLVDEQPSRTSSSIERPPARCQQCAARRSHRLPRGGRCWLERLDVLQWSWAWLHSQAPTIFFLQCGGANCRTTDVTSPGPPHAHRGF